MIAAHCALRQPIYRILSCLCDRTCSAVIPCSSADLALYFPLSNNFCMLRNSPSLASPIRSSSIGSGGLTFCNSCSPFPDFGAPSAMTESSRLKYSDSRSRDSLDQADSCVVLRMLFSFPECLEGSAKSKEDNRQAGSRVGEVAGSPRRPSSSSDSQSLFRYAEFTSDGHSMMV